MFGPRSAALLLRSCPSPTLPLLHPRNTRPSGPHGSLLAHLDPHFRTCSLSLKSKFLSSYRASVKEYRSGWKSYPVEAEEDPMPDRIDLRRAALFLCSDVLILVLVAWNLIQVYAILIVNNLGDFGRFYYSLMLYSEGRDMYGPTVGTFSPSDGLHYWNLNPPHFQLLIMPLGWLGPWLALFVWMGLGLLLFGLSVRIILTELGVRLDPLRWRLLLIVILAATPFSFGLLSGQLAFHLSYPTTLLWREMRHRRWLVSGVSFGLLLALKLFFLILVPYLLLKGRLRVLLLGLGVSGSLLGAGWLLFGQASYLSWVSVLAQVHWPGMDMNGSLLGFLTRTLGPSIHHEPVIVARHLVQPLWLLAAVAIGLITLGVCWIHRGTGEVDRSLALLLTAAMLITPVGWIHYAVLLMGPAAAWIVNLSSRRSTTLRNSAAFLLVLAAAPGLFWPSQLTPLIDPGPARTLVFGSMHFWMYSFFWLALLVEGFSWKRKLASGVVPTSRSGAL